MDYFNTCGDSDTGTCWNLPDNGIGSFKLAESNIDTWGCMLYKTGDCKGDSFWLDGSASGKEYSDTMKMTGDGLEGGNPVENKTWTRRTKGMKCYTSAGPRVEHDGDRSNWPGG